MRTILTEQQATSAGIKSGKEYAVAQGPILITGLEGDDKSNAAHFKRGVILAGGRSLATRDMNIVLRNDYRSIRMAKRVADAISARFYHYNRYGNREALAEGISDQQIELKLHPRYRDNEWRYKQVVRHIPLNESEVAARLRQQQLRDELMDPKTAARAALAFEAIGKDSIPFLKRALQGQHLETRFHAAVALAYLGDASGVPALAESIRSEPNYRAHAFAALSVTKDTDALLALRELLNERSPQTRYGAFRALTVLDKSDPSLRTERLADGFHFHELDLEGEPMIHLTKHQKPEVVIFGKGLKFELPVALSAGRHIMIRAQNDKDTVVISRFQLGKPDVRETVPNSIAGIIRRSVELGASYPDIAELLMQAQRQSNLPCRLEVDALPKAYNTFRRAGNVSASDDQADDAPMQLSSESELDEPADGSGRASAVDIRDEDEEPVRADPRPSLRDRFTGLFRRSKDK